jgi:hypothetical protein
MPEALGLFLSEGDDLTGAVGEFIEHEGDSRGSS